MGEYEMGPIAVLADPIMHVVFSGEHGQHVATVPKGRLDDHLLGEGNDRDDLWFCAQCEDHQYADAEPTICHECGCMRFRKGHQFIIIECKRSEVPAFITVTEAMKEVKKLDTGLYRLTEPVTGREEVAARLTSEPVVPVSIDTPSLKLDLEAHKQGRVKATDAKLGNVYTADSLKVTSTSLIDWQSDHRTLDTFRTALVTVGTAKTHATINGATTAASSGDTVEVYAGGASNVYVENVVDGGKQLDIIAKVAGHVLTIAGTGGTPVTLTGPCSTLVGFTVDCSGAISNGVYLNAAYANIVSCIIHSCTAGLARGVVTGTIGCRAINCIGYDSTNNIMGGSSLTGVFLYCHAQGGAVGIGGALANWAPTVYCTAHSTSSADFSNSYAVNSKMNASEDGTAPGAGSVTGLDPSDFTNYRLNTASTLAKFYGYPRIVSDDIDGNLRKTGGYVFAGASDPDPDMASTPAAPSITAVAVSGPAVTVTVDGDDGVTNWVRLVRRSTGAEADEQSRSGDGDVALTAPATSAAYDLVPYSQSGEYRSKPGAPWPVYVSAGAVQIEICEAIVARLTAASGVTDRLASADAIYRRRPARAAAHPCITYEISPVPDPEAPSDRVTGELAVELWGFERDTLDELLEAVTDALVGERLDTTNWTVKRLARLSVEPVGGETADEVTGRTLERVSTVWRFAAYRKGQ